jgi:hypothetical protein
VSDRPALLDEVIDAHGGRRRWRKVGEIHAHVRSGGLLPRMKLKSGKLADYGLSVDTGRQSAVLEPFPRAGLTGEFSGDAVRILDSDGSVRAEREHAREAFFGLSGVGRNLWWSDLDILYFAGYAMWNYLTIPFLFDSPGFELSEGEPIEADGERWRRLDVVFPEGFHTHCREQSFYFDAGGLLRRHDYSPDVVASFANAAHLCQAHQEFDGLVFPTRRQVLPKGPGGRPLSRPTMVWIELDSISTG